MVALETKIDSDGCSKKAKVLCVQRPTHVTSDNRAACSHFCANVVPRRQGKSTSSFCARACRPSTRLVTRAQYLRASCVQMLLMSLMIEYRSGASCLRSHRHTAHPETSSGKAGMSSTSQQLQLLQQVQRAQNLHAVLAHVQRRQVLH